MNDITYGVAAETWEEAIARAEEILEVAEEWREEGDVKFEEDVMEWIRLGKKKEAEKSQIKTK